MREAQKGSAQAFAELHAALVPVIRNFIASLDSRLSPHDLDDLVQETVVALWQRLPDYREEASAKTFTCAIARNITLKHASKRQRSPMVYTGDFRNILGRPELCEQPDSLPTELSENETRIQQAMDKLTDLQRQAIELKLSHGSRRAAAKEAGCTTSQLGDRLYYAKKRLRQFLNGMLHCFLLFAFGAMVGF